MAFSRIVKYITHGGIAASLIGGFKQLGSGDINFGLALIFVIPAVVLAPRLLYRKYFQKDFSVIFLAEVEALVLTSISLMVLGEIVFYKNIPGFDSLVHLLNGLLITVLVVLLNYKKWLARSFGVVTAVIVAGLVPALIGEIYEISYDALFGTQIWGDVYWNFKSLWFDTASDIFLQLMGSILAILILKKYLDGWLKRYKNHEQPPQEQPPLVSPHSKQV